MKEEVICLRKLAISTASSENCDKDFLPAIHRVIDACNNFLFVDYLKNCVEDE